MINPTTIKPIPGEASIVLPTFRLAMTMLLAAAAVAGAWLAVGSSRDWQSQRLMTCMFGAGLAVALSLASLLIMAPWTRRSISTWMSFWLGGTVFRLLLTPIATYVLYSATSLSGRDLGWSVATAYLAVLFSEAIVLSHSLRCQT
jgi:hypothetical protein